MGLKSKKSQFAKCIFHISICETCDYSKN